MFIGNKEFKTNKSLSFREEGSKVIFFKKTKNMSKKAQKSAPSVNITKYTNNNTAFYVQETKEGFKVTTYHLLDGKVYKNVSKYEALPKLYR